MNKTLVIIGAGGHAKVCYDISIAMNKWSKIVILDDNLKNNFFKISGIVSTYVDYPEADFFVAIGSNIVRRRLCEKIIGDQYNLATLIHPSSIISTHTKIGKGTVIMPGAIVNASTSIGDGCIINTKVSLDHDTSIGDYTHISPGVSIAGNVTIGKESWIGIGTVIKNNVNVSSRVIVGANSTVLKNLEISGTYFGTPAMLRER